jgi:protein involved in ribonucleotide reduction
MIVYTSRTGNVKHIVNNLKLPNIEITDDLIVTEPYFLITYTDKLGEVPEVVTQFLLNNHIHLKGVIASGNVNFGEEYCKSADVISDLYSVPVIRRIDLRGNKQDILEILKQYNKYMR